MGIFSVGCVFVICFCQFAITLHTAASDHSKGKGEER